MQKQSALRDVPCTYSSVRLPASWFYIGHSVQVYQTHILKDYISLGSLQKQNQWEREKDFFEGIRSCDYKDGMPTSTGHASRLETEVSIDSAVRAEFLLP